MDIDESQNDEYEYEPLEEKLEHLGEYDNLTQLQLLIQEIDHLVDHAIQPPREWFETRMDHVLLYAGLNWRDLADQSFDSQLSDGAKRIVQCGVAIMDQWSTMPVFDLSEYYTLLHTVEETYTYFVTQYGEEKTDVDLFDVMAGLDRL